MGYDFAGSKEGGLGRSAKERGSAVAGHEFTQHMTDGYEQMNRERLHLIENNNAPGNPMKFAATRRPVCEKAFKELNTRGDDDGSIPVFAGQAIQTCFMIGVYPLEWVFRITAESPRMSRYAPYVVCSMMLV